MNAIIASESIFGQRSGEERFKISVEIGMPYKFGEDPEEWACPLSVSPLCKKLHDVHGGSSLQALCLAMSLAQDLLNSFKEKGGVLSYDTGDYFPLEAYSFGVAAKRSA